MRNESLWPLLPVLVLGIAAAAVPRLALLPGGQRTTLHESAYASLQQSYPRTAAQITRPARPTSSLAQRTTAPESTTNR